MPRHDTMVFCLLNDQLAPPKAVDHQRLGELPELVLLQRAQARYLLEVCKMIEFPMQEFTQLTAVSESLVVRAESTPWVSSTCHRSVGSVEEDVAQNLTPLCSQTKQPHSLSSPRIPPFH